MLKLYETLQQYSIPQNLKDEVYDREGKQLDSIDNFTKINIFVGSNNSGKSKFIRELIRQKQAPYYGNKTWQSIYYLIDNFFDVIDRKLREIYATHSDFTISNSGNGQIVDTHEVFSHRKEFLQNIPNYNLQ